MNRTELFNAANSGRLAGGIAERTVQKWAKRLKEDKDWNILEKQTNLVNRPKPQLGPEHKTHLSTVHNFLKTECNLSFKKVTLRPVARNNNTKIDIYPKHKEAVCPVLLRLKRNDTVSIKEVISELEDFVVKDYSPENTLESFKGVWLNRIGGCANLLKLELVSEKNTTFYSKIT
ncbi:hypothetical protein RMATCC62417_12404 [Rhizopus microsporus]|nr:hypothetical protein RMATCC62417_12404 [Rhizopus microsporus]